MVLSGFLHYLDLILHCNTLPDEGRREGPFMVERIEATLRGRSSSSSSEEIVGFEIPWMLRLTGQIFFSPLFTSEGERGRGKESGDALEGHLPSFEPHASSASERCLLWKNRAVFRAEFNLLKSHAVSVQSAKNRLRRGGNSISQLVSSAFPPSGTRSPCTISVVAFPGGGIKFEEARVGR